ncbi:MAG TPA: VanW family protein, partial [Clostridia bacterium]|nr:VanW family protein [Clostridia bacterium]
RIDSWNLSLTFRGHTFITLNYGALGIQVKEEELYQLLSEAWKLTHTGDIYARKAAIDTLTITPHRVSTARGELQSTQLQTIFSQIAAAINSEPVDAVLLEFRPDEVQPFVFLDEKAGLRLDVDAAMQQVMAFAVQGQSGSYELEPQVIPPLITRAELEKTVRLRTSIATAIDKSSTDERNHNIRLSFSKFNGMILKPGQTLSFNEVVGPRTIENGFAEALEYAYGDLVIGVGGGVCQASTTLYQAAVTAGLSIVKRYPHSGPVDYTQLGQDATVFLSRDRNIDFVFRNTTAGNIYITAHVQPTRNNAKRLEAVIRMYGQDLGDGVSYKLRSEVVKVLEPPQEKIYENDKEGKYVTYTDEEKLKSKAVKGQVIETYLEKYQHGVLVEPPKLISSDTFNAKAAVYYRGVNKRP